MSYLKNQNNNESENDSINVDHRELSSQPAINREPKSNWLKNTNKLFSFISDPSQRKIGANLIRFLILLLILTLIARASSGATLAKVEISNPARSEIVEAITGNATVSTKATLNIYLPEGLTILETLVGIGQEVTYGDAIAILDISEVNKRLLSASVDLNKLMNELIKLERSDSVDSSTLTSAQKSLQRAREDYENTAKRCLADIAAAEEVLNETLKSNLDTVDSTAVDMAKVNLKRANEDYDRIKSQGDIDVAKARKTFEDTETDEYEKLQEWLNASSTQKEEAEQRYLLAQQNTEITLNALEALLAKLEESLLSAKRKIEDAEDLLKKAQSEYEKAIEKATESSKEAIERARTAVENAKSKATEDLLNASRRVEDAQMNLEKAEKDYEKSTLQSSDIASLNQLNAIGLKSDIDDQKIIVDTLELLAKNNGILYSDISGRVSAVQPNGNTTGRDAVVSFMDGAKGYEAYLTLKKTDANKLSVGDTCKVTTGGGSVYYTPTVDGIISSIMALDEQNSIGITIKLSDGNWIDNQRVEVQTILSSMVYDMCLPLSGIHSDNTGYYVYVIERKTTVLGIENMVVKVYVNIISSDDDIVAVQGPLDRNSRVIIGSNKAISENDRVRLSN